MRRIQRYVSKELAHFVGRGMSADDQFALLVRILQSGWLTHPPHIPNVSGNLNVNSSARLSTNEMYAPEVVCFSDIPVEDLYLHAAKYSPCGLAFSKTFIAGRGGCPVFYLPRGTRLRQTRDLEPGPFRREGAASLFQEVELGQVFDRMLPEFHSLMDLFRDLIRGARSTPGVPADFRRLHALLMFLEFRVFSQVKFFDESLDDDDPENFYMEREWRVVGNLNFELNDVRRLIIPERYAARLREAIPEFVGQVTFSD